MLIGINEAAKLTGLSTWELRTGAKKGKYPFYRIGEGGKNTPYKFDIDLLQEAIKKECLHNAEEQKRLIEEEEKFCFRVPRVVE